MELRRYAYKGKGSIWMPLVLLFLVCAMPAYSLFISNIGELRFIEAFIIMIATYVIGLILFGFIWLVLRNRMLSGLIASASLFLFMNFGIIYDAIRENTVKVPVAYVSYAISLVIVIFLSVLLISFTRRSSLIPKKITMFLLFILSLNTILITVFALPKILKTAEPNTISDVSYDIVSLSGNSKPNIYFIITDEYASFPCGKKYYQYDNVVFHDYLSENKFNISETSYSYSTCTYNSLGSLASLQPLESPLTTLAAKEHILKKDNLQYQLLEKLGYDIKEVSAHHTYPFKNTSKKKKNIISRIFKSQAENGDNTLKIIMDKTMLYKISRSMAVSNTSTENVLSYFTDENFLENTSQVAYFCYILSPHVPFTHDEHGNKISITSRGDWENPEIYLGQLKYTTTLLMSAIDAILTNDPNSVIVLQSDHGVRYHADGEPPHQFIIEENDMRSIFNVVYFSGESMDIQGLSAINTWRLVFQQLGVNIDLIDDSRYKIVVNMNAEVQKVQRK